MPYLLRNHQILKWATLAHQSDFGLDSAELFSRVVRQNGGEILISDEYLPETTDFRTQLLKIISKHPQGLFLPSYTEAGIIMKQARDLGFKGQFAGLTTFENPDIIALAGSSANGAIYSAHFDPDGKDQGTLDYQRRYFDKYGHRSEQFAAVAYEGLHICNEVFGKCLKDIVCVKHLLDSEIFQGIAGKVSFDKYGDPIMRIAIREIQAGGYTTIQP